MSSKRQTTMAKLQRERRVEERRTLKREKKQAAAAARKAGELPEDMSAEDQSEETSPAEQPEEISATLGEE